MTLTRSRKFVNEQAHIDQRAGKKVETSAPTENTGRSLGWLKSRLGPNLLTILLVIAGIIVFCFGIYSSSLRTPRAGEIGTLVWERWFWVLILWGILAALIALKAGKAAKTLQWVLAGVVVAGFIVLPVGSWVAGPSDHGQQQVSEYAQCTPEHPCVLEQTDTGTKKVSIPEGWQVCFDPSFWNNVLQLGYMTSYKGGPEKKYSCTREQILDGTCKQQIGDSFRFVPKKKETPLPQYWFTKRGGC